MILQFASRLQRSRQPPCRPAGRPGQMRWGFQPLAVCGGEQKQGFYGTEGFTYI